MLGSKHKSVGRDLSKEHFLQLTVERITRQRYAQTKAQRSIRLMVYMRWTVGESPELLIRARVCRVARCEEVRPQAPRP